MMSTTHSSIRQIILPFTMQTCPVDLWVRRKDGAGNKHQVCTIASEGVMLLGPGFVSYEALLEFWDQIDGSPCGLVSDAPVAMEAEQSNLEALEWEVPPFEDDWRTYALKRNVDHFGMGCVLGEMEESDLVRLAKHFRPMIEKETGRPLTGDLDLRGALDNFAREKGGRA